MLNFTYFVVYSGDNIAEVKQCSEYMLGELEKQYPDVFSEPIYIVWEHRQPF